MCGPNNQKANATELSNEQVRPVHDDLFREENSRDIGGRHRTWFDWLAVGVAGLAFLAAAWQAYVAWHSERRSLRAYVFVDSVKLARNDAGELAFWHVYPTSGGAELMVSYTPKNEGVTPAYNVERLVEIDLRSYPLSGNIVLKYTHGTSAYVAKSQEFFPILTRAFTEDERKAILAGEDRRLYFFGQLRYSDVFTSPHVTGFCFMYTKVVDELKFIACDRWSEYDMLQYAN
jgi:hypothetical protein